MALTVSEVKVMHIPPKPFSAREMKISTDRAARNEQKPLMGQVFKANEHSIFSNCLHPPESQDGVAIWEMDLDLENPIWMPI